MIIIMSVRLIITMCHRGRVNFGRVMVNDRRRRPEMEKYNICCCSPRSLLILLLEPRGAAAGLIRFIFSKSFIITRSGTAPAVGLNRASSSSSAVTRDSHAALKKIVHGNIVVVLRWSHCSRYNNII